MVAIAMVIDTWGSSPCPPGSLLAVCDDGRFEGSVSGGCIEGSVVTEALGLLDGGHPRLKEYGIPDNQAWEAGLACGGRLSVFIAGVDDAALFRALIEGSPAALVTDLKTGRHAIVGPDHVTGDIPMSAEEIADARQALLADTSRRITSDKARLFAASFNPRPQVIIVGAVHIAQSLAPMARMAGFDVVVIDPRLTFASSERFPGVTLNHQWPDEALTATGLGAHSAVVALSHDPKLDDPALDAALRSHAFYIGALGSRGTQAKRLDRLRSLGFAESDLARIHGPIGLDLGGRKPAEIAVAILAQIIAARYGKPAERPGPVGAG
ncbi:MAG: XdhC family protein [Rhodospirillales bacterium]|nr:XdhC family protein [Rhodospirillales bacterium]